MTEQLIDHGKSNGSTDGQSDGIYLEINLGEIGNILRHVKQAKALGNFETDVEKEHRELPMQSATDHGKQNDRFKDVRSYPQVVIQYHRGRHGLPRRIYTLSRQPTTTALTKP